MSKKFFAQRPRKQMLIPFPVYMIPFPVFITSFGLLRLNENYSVKEVLLSEAYKWEK